MRYEDSIAQSAQTLRMALPLMSRQRAALHPVSYAVWYEHVSGRNGALSRELNALTRDGQSIDEAQTWSLYQRHIAELDEDSASRLEQGFKDLLQGMAQSAEQAGLRTQAYGRALQDWQEALRRAAPGQHMHVLAEVMQGTSGMHTAMHALAARLASTQEEIERLHREVQRARSEALLDTLTGLSNRRGFEQALQRCLGSPDAGTPVGPCLILGDIDEFQRMRQQLAAPALDELLLQLAGILRGVTQAHHVAARLGDDEFALLMPSAGLHEAVAVAEQFRQRVNHLQSANGRVSLSVGLTQLGRDESAAAFVTRADQALKLSRAQGRNRVTVVTREDALAA